ncbi:helix-turn-helix domain-containing protein [Kribbella jejuensis]|uniref:Helix-turn-helix protein n=1 Tax=Kribbella jejuensis TaxID=236068 RepID=A0A542E936_9ACTN|nr:helix-turn-helix transcriptional regulator [Kribbella jejuensis]TQJ11842.1 helix-turn-helix protein [Kribbella jejuensis]
MTMNGYSKWEDVKAKAQAADSRSPAERAAGKQAARERREAYVRGHQLAEMRKAAGVTQTALAELLQVSQARISKIESGEISGIDVIRAYVTALGGSVDLVATLGDRTWKVA